jgi:hypothetical protein
MQDNNIISCNKSDVNKSDVVNKIECNTVIDSKLEVSNVESSSDKIVGKVSEIGNNISKMLNGDGIYTESSNASFLEETSSASSSKITLIDEKRSINSQTKPLTTTSSVSAKQQIMELFLNSQNMSNTDNSSESSNFSSNTSQKLTDYENSNSEISHTTTDSDDSDFNESTYSKYLNKVSKKDYEKSKKTFKNIEYLNKIGNIIVNNSSSSEEETDNDIYTLNQGEVQLDVMGEHTSRLQQPQRLSANTFFSETQQRHEDIDKHYIKSNSNFSDTSWDVYSKYEMIKNQYDEQAHPDETLLQIIQYLLDFPVENKVIFFIVLILILMLIGINTAPWVFCSLFILNGILIQGRDNIVNRKVVGERTMEENLSCKMENEVQLKILNGDISVTDRILIPFKIKNNKVIGELDSGAAVNVLSESIILAANPNYIYERKAKKYRLSTVDGSTIPTLGAYYIPCSFSGIGVINIPFHIVTTERVSLLGRPFLIQTNLTMKVTGNKIKISLHPRKNKVYNPPFVKNINKIELQPSESNQTIFKVKNFKNLKQNVEKIIPFQSNNPNIKLEYKIYNLDKYKSKIGLIITNIGEVPLHLEPGGLVALVLPYIPEKNEEINITGFRSPKFKPIKAVEIVDFQSNCKIISDQFISTFLSGINGKLNWHNFKDTTKYFLKNIAGNFIINKSKNVHSPCPK